MTSAAGFSTVYVNGKPADSLSVFDRGLQYGDGLFETIPVIHQQAIFLDQHLDRLKNGLECLGFVDVDLDTISREIRHLAAGQIEKSVIKLILTRGNSERGYRIPGNISVNTIISISPFPDYEPVLYREGVNIRFCETRLSSNEKTGGLKHLCRLEQVLARNEWDDPEIFEGLMLNSDNQVIEGTFTNLFLLNGNGMISTPAINSCGVKGIMRSHVMDILHHEGFSVTETAITKKECLTASGLFLTNSIIGVLPVKKLEMQTFEKSILPESVNHKIMAWKDS